MLLDWIAAFLLLAGSATVLIAAIGVARLPDAFMRMHAATKAGVVGAGLVLLGTGLAMGTAGAVITSLVVVAFLLATTPISSHLLGRAAYAAGAPLWGGTIADQLEGVLSREVFDISPMRRARAATTGSDGTGAAVIELRGQPLPLPQRSTLRHLIVGLVGGEGAEGAVEHAVALAVRHEARLTALSLIDPSALENVGPVPPGGIAFARQQVEERVRRGREARAALVQRFEDACRDAGVAHEILHEEGKACKALSAASQCRDLVILPADLAESGVPTNLARQLLSAGVRPILAVAGPVRPVRRVGFHHDGGQRSAQTMRWLVQSGLWDGAEVSLVGVGEGDEALERALEAAAAYLGDHGIGHEVTGLVTAMSALDTELPLRLKPDTWVVGNAGCDRIALSLLGGERALRGLDCVRSPMLLG